MSDHPVKTVAQVNDAEVPVNGPTANGSRRPATTPAEPLLIPDTEAARLAGVCRATWHRLRAAGKVPPAVKLGRACRWRRAEIVAWIEQGCPDGRTWSALQAAAGRRNARIVG